MIHSRGARPASLQPSAHGCNIRYDFRHEPARHEAQDHRHRQLRWRQLLPKEPLAHLRLDKGDELYALETPDGICLTTYDPEFAAQMDVAEKIMHGHRELPRKLAQ